MNTSFLPFILVKQGHYIKALIKKGAIDSHSAVTMEEANIPNTFFLKKLMRQNLILETEEKKLYANVDLLSKNSIWKTYLERHSSVKTK